MITRGAGGGGRQRIRLGGEFARLWTASALTNVADGVTLAAGPLLVSSLTDDPVLIGSAVFVTQLPWLLFSLISGAYVDRLDRRRLLVVVNLVRGAVVTGLAATIATGTVSVPIIYAAFFLIGTSETLADNASNAMLPTLVSVAALPKANARLVAVQMGVNQFVGPPLGASLFALAATIPFGLNAAAFTLAAVVLGTLPRRAGTPAPVQRRPLWTEIREGAQWMWRNRVLRMISVTLCGMNLTLFSTLAIFVVYAQQRLGLGEIGYGVLLATMAVGGIIGAGLVSRLRARLADSVLLRAGLVLETLTHVVLALVTEPWVAAMTLVIFGMHNGVWDVVSVSWRQRIVPDALRGRANSVHMLFGVGGAALGSLAGGPIVKAFGVTAPFWTAAALMAVLTVVAWRAFGRHLVDDVAPAPAEQRA
ncbi:MULTISPECIES: MFS transporter [Prauserella salsuginis group]|uniref:MFS family permease n=2 Tax=Prauserella salsuginis group TaxID=2893672 RepID=A0A839XRZ0_9PSEU|nr:MULTISPECIES: MFS transporter [Prauserella salsuginis group]MBB3662645.1 MFS family permease [Prauserella sediminis]MCR3720343.1 putative arabinose efflux permease, MFS family [Prauserella flava]MCR3733948.1 putative arabinose efflux permease, MFS family [Prauserella salsuginis]